MKPHQELLAGALEDDSNLEEITALFKALEEGRITAEDALHELKSWAGLIDLKLCACPGPRIPGQAEPKSSEGMIMKFVLNRKAILTGLSRTTREAIKQRYTLDNPAYAEAEKMGRSTYGIDRELKFYEETEDGLICPRGHARQLYFLCQQMGEKIDVVDERRTLPPVEFTFARQLRELQRPAVDGVLSHDFGLLEAGTGAGKTVMGLNVIAERKQPTLIIVHTKELLNQWIDRIETFLGIPRDEIGVIGGGKFKIGDRITVGMVQTIYKRVQEIVPPIGHLVIDECHKAPSRTFTEAVTAFDCKFMLGLTATPWRRDKLSKVIFWHVGDVTGRIAKQDLLEAGNLCQAEVQWIETEFNPSLDASLYYSKALSELTEDETRNRLICQAVSNDNGHGISLILSDRKAHCDTLQNILSDVHGVHAAVLTGSTTLKDRERMISDLQQGKCRYLIATGQLIGEGFDLPGISTVFLTTPVKFSGRLIQYIGRALRPAPGKDKSVIFDFVDILDPVFEASAKSRMNIYKNERIAA